MTEAPTPSSVEASENVPAQDISEPQAHSSIMSSSDQGGGAQFSARVIERLESMWTQHGRRREVPRGVLPTVDFDAPGLDAQERAVLRAAHAYETEHGYGSSRVEGVTLQVEDAPAPTLPPASQNTDLGNADRFVRLHGHEARYVYEWKSWLVWDGTRWHRDVGAAERLAQETSRAILLEAAQVNDDDRRQQLSRWAVQSQSGQRLRGMLECARPHLEAKADDFDRDGWSMGCTNGVLDLRTGELRQARSDDLLTRSTHVAYRPEAKATRFEAFLCEVQPDPQMRAFLQRLAGMALVGEVRDHVLPIHHGHGANGKTVFVEATRHAMGDYALALEKKVLEDAGRSQQVGGASPDVVRLRGSRLAVASEIEAAFKLNEATVKSLTGGDRITARALYQDSIEFDPTWSIWLVTNHLPRIDDMDEAIWRRIKQVPWGVTIPPSQRDPDLGAKLEAEAEGILAWAVEGCLAWQRDGLMPPSMVELATGEYRADSDPLGAFLSDRCEVPLEGEDVDDFWVMSGALYDAYVMWCEMNAVEAVHKRRWGPMLRGHGFKDQKRHQQRGWTGLRLTQRGEQPVQDVRTSQDDRLQQPPHEGPLRESSPKVTSPDVLTSCDSQEAARPTWSELMALALVGTDGSNSD